MYFFYFSFPVDEEKALHDTSSETLITVRDFLEAGEGGRELNNFEMCVGVWESQAVIAIFNRDQSTH